MEGKDDNNLAHDIDILKYASFRQNEVQLLSNEAFLAKENKQKSLFQLLPRHMRRRTMGFIRKRLPHRIRKQAQIKPPSKIKKRPSRKFRRRPSNLRQEYERRKNLQDNMWLETHIWHAKRFHMAKMYGYRLALHENGKCKRNVVKNLKDFCCIHDESYYVCYELKGHENDLVKGLNRLCSEKTGLTFSAKIFFSGKCEGRISLYEADQYPYKCIGPCKFMWKPEQNENRIIWIWLHPSIHKQVEEEFMKIFKLDHDQNDSPLAKKRKLNCDNLNQDINEDIKMENLAEETIENCLKSESEKVTITCLKDKLVRFKLMGPTSTSILGNVLGIIENENFQKQSNIWNHIKFSIKEPSEVCPSVIIGLLVKDPRLLLPKKKAFKKIFEIHSKPESNLDYETRKVIISENLSHYLIWDKEYIEKLNLNKKTTFQINKIRSQFLIPGTNLTGIETDSQIPVLLIQNGHSGNFNKIKNGNLMSGWDIILPNTWAMDFWMALVQYGCKAIGQNELNYLNFESGNFQFPREFGDCKSSGIENDIQKEKLYKIFLSRPPSKRVNFLKNGIMSPFYLPWRSILQLNSCIELKTNILNLDKQYYILRDKKVLSKINTALFNRNKQLKLNFISDEFVRFHDSFIGIRLEAIGRGNLDTFSLLYDYFEIESDKDKKKRELFHLRLVSNKIIDEYKLEFINKLDSKNDQITLNKLLRSKFNKFEILKDENWFFKHQMEFKDSNFYKSPIGFVCSSGFSLVNGKCSANGFILTKYVLNLIDRKYKQNKFEKNLLNYKEPNSSMFKTAKINQIFI